MTEKEREVVAKELQLGDELFTLTFDRFPTREM